MTADDLDPIGPIVTHLFRHSAGRIVAALARVLGPERLDLAEEVAQDALVRALETWPYRGVPDNPRGWLFQVARHRALDLLRREATFRTKTAALGDALDTALGRSADRDGGGDIDDDELAMIFMCCHPALPHPSRIALTLKTVGGFSVTEIGAALLAEPAAVAQRIVRAKRQIRDEHLPLELPGESELRPRLDAALDVVYLMFNEGYAAHGGDNLTRADLCGEAIRLGRLLAQNPATDLPHVNALLALLLLQASRLPAREDAAGDLLLIEAQDRRRWDRAMIDDGMRHLERAAAGDELTPWHLEADIAACHAVAPDAAATDWARVLGLYDDLLALKPSPVVELNRAIALAMVEGPPAGVAALEALRGHDALCRYHLLPAALAALRLRSGDAAGAACDYRAALALPCSVPERRFLARQLARCEGTLRGPHLQ